jgi:hypothetical protein
MENNLTVEVPKFERNCYISDGLERVEDLNLTTEELNGLVFLKRQWRTVHIYGFTILQHFDGRQRSGKSVSAILLATIYDKTFLPNFKRRVVHSADDFLMEVERIEKQGIKGAVIVVDEAGESMGSSDWYQAFADAINKSLMVFGYLHIIVFFVSPVKDFLLSGLRKMTNVYVRVKRYTNTETNLIIYDLDYGLKKNRMEHFYKKPRLNIFGEKKIIRKLKIRNPPKWLMEQYHALEMERKPKIMSDLRNSGMKREQKEVREGTIEDKVKFVLDNISMFEGDRSTHLEPKLDADLIKASSLGIATFREALTVKKIAERRLKVAISEKAAIIGGNNAL